MQNDILHLYLNNEIAISVDYHILCTVITDICCDFVVFQHCVNDIIVIAVLIKHNFIFFFSLCFNLDILVVSSSTFLAFILIYQLLFLNYFLLILIASLMFFIN